MLNDKELSHMKDVKVVASRHFGSKKISTKLKLMEIHSANCGGIVELIYLEFRCF